MYGESARGRQPLARPELPRGRIVVTHHTELVATERGARPERRGERRQRIPEHRPVGGRAVVLVGDDHQREVGVGAAKAGVPTGLERAPGRLQVHLEAAAGGAALDQAAQRLGQVTAVVADPVAVGAGHVAHVVVGHAAAAFGRERDQHGQRAVVAERRATGHAGGTGRAGVGGHHADVQIGQAADVGDQRRQQGRRGRGQLLLLDRHCRRVVDHQQQVELRRRDGRHHPRRVLARRPGKAWGAGAGLGAGGALAHAPVPAWHLHTGGRRPVDGGVEGAGSVVATRRGRHQRGPRQNKHRSLGSQHGDSSVVIWPDLRIPRSRTRTACVHARVRP
jgi:hypothetical protein